MAACHFIDEIAHVNPRAIRTASYLAPVSPQARLEFRKEPDNIGRFKIAKAVGNAGR